MTVPISSRATTSAGRRKKETGSNIRWLATCVRPLLAISGSTLSTPSAPDVWNHRILGSWFSCRGSRARTRPDDGRHPASRTRRRGILDRSGARASRWATADFRSSTSAPPGTSRWRPTTGASSSRSTVKSTTSRRCDERLAAAGASFRGHSDTEIMLSAISAWGLESAVQAFAGQFAFALWDRKRRELHLVRDRLGEKPLYFGRMGKTLLFGSELKALRAHPAWRGSIDRSRVDALPASRLRPGSRIQSMKECTKVEPASDRDNVAATGRSFPSSGTGSWTRSIRRRPLTPAGGRRIRDPRSVSRQGLRSGRGRADGRRRSGGRLPLWWRRFLDHCGADAGAKQPSGPDVHHRVPRWRVRRGCSRTGRSPIT